MTRRDLPNLISFFRLLLALPVAALIIGERHELALAGFIVAGLSDGLDGFLAKRYDWRSELGGMLDPVADKLLVISTLFSLAISGLIPWWLLIVVIVRELVVVGGSVAYRLLLGPFEAAPTRLSKLNTLMLLVVIVAVLSAQTGVRISPTLLDWLPLIALVTVAVSGVDYVIAWSRRSRKEFAARRN